MRNISKIVRQTSKMNFFLRVFRTKYPLTEPFLSVILWSKDENEQQTRKTLTNKNKSTLWNPLLHSI